jgi:hypothetical protein
MRTKRGCEKPGDCISFQLSAWVARRLLAWAMLPSFKSSGWATAIPHTEVPKPQTGWVQPFRSRTQCFYATVEIRRLASTPPRANCSPGLPRTGGVSVC